LDNTIPVVVPILPPDTVGADANDDDDNGADDDDDNGADANNDDDNVADDDDDDGADDDDDDGAIVALPNGAAEENANFAPNGVDDDVMFTVLPPNNDVTVLVGSVTGIGSWAKSDVDDDAPNNVTVFAGVLPG